MLKDYSDIFGKPNTGVHSYRIFNIAIVDLIFTIIAAYFIHIYIKVNFLKALIILFLLGIICHEIFNVNTTVRMYLK